jgi:hypothetical protein
MNDDHHFDNPVACSVEGCRESGYIFEIDNPEISEIFTFCPQHAYEFGFCPSCGSFCGGIESFHFGPNAKSEICFECWEQIELENEPDDDDDGWGEEWLYEDD